MVVANIHFYPKTKFEILRYSSNLQQLKFHKMTNSNIERREFARFSVPAHEFFAYCHETKKMTMVMDISLGGLQIECYPSAESGLNAMTIDIYTLPQERFYLADLPCRVVYDIANLAQDSAFSGANSRIAGLRYKKLTDEQKEKLEHALNFMEPVF